MRNLSRSAKAGSLGLCKSRNTGQKKLSGIAAKRADTDFHLSTVRNDVSRLTRNNAADGNDRRFQRIDIARHNAL